MTIFIEQGDNGGPNGFPGAHKQLYRPGHHPLGESDRRTPMAPSRRDFLIGTAAAVISQAGRGVRGRPGTPPAGDRFDPWLEVDSGAIAHNVAAVSRLAGGRPILAVVKNNAYGLGLEVAGPILDRLPQIAGFAVVRAAEAERLKTAGVRKRVLLMGRCTDQESEALARIGVRLASTGEDDATRLGRLAARIGRRVGTHLYVDTGMSRMGFPWQRASGWALRIAAQRQVRIDGMFTELTEDADFDRQQVGRLSGLARELKARGVTVGPLHAASSAAVMGQPDTFLDMVRPGIALYGGYPNTESRASDALRCAIRLKARVVRVEHLEAGDGVNYHRRWRAAQPTWVATLPVGHVDGYPSSAVKGAEILIGERLYRAIGSVSASHTIIEVGAEQSVKVGDVPTLIGPDRPALYPNEIAARTGYSEYDMFMHLSPTLPRIAEASISRSDQSQRPPRILDHDGSHLLDGHA